MSLLGKWRIIELPGYEDDDADRVEPAFIDFDQGAFAFGCVTGGFHGGGETPAVAFDWDGNDEMDETGGSGWPELQPDGSLRGEIRLHQGEIAFIARRWATSSTAC
ncbi:MAG: hypothetical protein KGL55_01360 [Rhodospirillales bacterium]|nr:hypothetical protein [Rhodospirillales bacterium]